MFVWNLELKSIIFYFYIKINDKALIDEYYKLDIIC
jgi:hypothetical protein